MRENVLQANEAITAWVGVGRKRTTEKKKPHLSQSNAPHSKDEQDNFCSAGRRAPDALAIPVRVSLFALSAQQRALLERKEESERERECVYVCE